MMTPIHRSTSWRGARALAWALALLSAAACTEAKKKRDKAPAAEAAAPAPAATPVAPATPPPAATPAIPAAPAAAAAAAPKPGLDPAKAKGKSRLELSLPAPMKVGGFGFTATYDAEKFHVAEPVTAPSMQGYMCQANLAQPGTIRFNCAGLVPDARGGLVATFDVSYASAPPVEADFVVTSSEIVDDMARRVEGSSLKVAIAPVPAR